MDQLSTFLFEVVFRDNTGLPGETDGFSICDRSVIVEVEPQNADKEAAFFPSEAARNYAKELAPQIAIQVVQKDLPHGFEPNYSVREIDRLPAHLHHRSPKFHGIGFRAWLL
jgi:hypothetical protein